MNQGPTSTRLDGRGIGGGAIAVIALLALVYIGSEGLRWLDAALAPYLFGTLLAAFATVYRHTVWLRRPPTARLNRRGWEALRSTGRLGSNLLALGGMLVTNLALQRFIAFRSRTRWLAPTPVLGPWPVRLSLAGPHCLSLLLHAHDSAAPRNTVFGHLIGALAGYLSLVLFALTEAAPAFETG